MLNVSPSPEEGGGDEFEFNGIKIRTRRRWYNIDNVYTRNIKIPLLINDTFFHSNESSPPLKISSAFALFEVIRDFFHRSLFFFFYINCFSIRRDRKITLHVLLNFTQFFDIFFFFFSRSHNKIWRFRDGYIWEIWVIIIAHVRLGKIRDASRCYCYRMRSGEMKTGKVYVTNAVMRLRYAERTAFASTWIRDRSFVVHADGEFSGRKIYTVIRYGDLRIWDSGISRNIYDTEWSCLAIFQVSRTIQLASFPRKLIERIIRVTITMRLLFCTFHFFFFYIIVL